MSAPHAFSPDVRAHWGPLLSAFVKEVDGTINAAVRDAWLRRAGAQMALDRALPQVDSLDELERQVNAALADLGWGKAEFSFDPASRVLTIRHARVPTVDAAARTTPPWFPAVLEGLYTAWLGQQPDAGSADLQARQSAPLHEGSVALVYGHSERIGTLVSPSTSTAKARGI